MKLPVCDFSRMEKWLYEHVDMEFWSMIFLGLCFMVSLTSDFTIGNMQKIFMSSIHDDDPAYQVDSNVIFGLIYIVYAIVLWVVPSIMAIIGPKYGLILGSVSLMIMVFLYSLETAWVTYLGTVLAGIGGSFVWVAQGTFMIMSSSHFTIHRNVGIIWIFYSMSMIFGNLFAASELEHKERIDWGTRHSLVYKLCGIALAGIVIMFFLPQPYKHKNKIKKKDPTGETEEPKQSAIDAFRTTWHIFCSVEMQLLLITFIYVGFQQSFGTGIYSSAVGFTKKFGEDAKELVPVCGLVFGIGELLGGITFLILGRLLRNTRNWGSVLMCVGIAFQIVAYITIFLNIPSSAVFGETSESAIIESKGWIAMLSSILMGVGDCFLNTQIMPMIAKLQPDYSAQTCALYKFTKSMSMAAYFFLGTCMSLHVQTIVNTCLGLIGVMTFVLINRKIESRQ